MQNEPESKVANKPKQKKKSKKQIHSPQPQPSQPSPDIHVNPGLAALAKREPKHEPTDFPVVNIRYDFTVKRWAIFDDQGKVIEHVDHAVLIDVQFVVEPCGQERVEGCGGSSDADIQCGHAKGKIIGKEKPQSMPKNAGWIKFHKYTGVDCDFYTMNLNRVRSADYLVLGNDKYSTQVINPRE